MLGCGGKSFPADGEWQGQFKHHHSGRRRQGQALNGRLVLSTFDDRTGIRGAFIFVVIRKRRSFSMSAAGEEVQAVGGFDQKAMRGCRQPENCQQDGQNASDAAHA